MTNALADFRDGPMPPPASWSVCAKRRFRAGETCLDALAWWGGRKRRRRCRFAGVLHIAGVAMESWYKSFTTNASVALMSILCWTKSAACLTDDVGGRIRPA